MCGDTPRFGLRSGPGLDHRAIDGEPETLVKIGRAGSGMRYSSSLYPEASIIRGTANCMFIMIFVVLV